MNVIWSIAIIIFIIAEAVSTGLTSIWFVLGAFFALIASVVSAPLWLQITIFIIASIISLVLTRPMVKKYVNSRSQPTNADRLIGTTGVVIETIDNIAATGTVSVNRKLWTTRAADGSIIEPKTLVIVQKIEGAKLVVLEAEKVSTTNK